MKPAIIDDLRAIVGDDAIFTRDAELRVYESDALTAFHGVPEVVVLPAMTEQVQAVVRVCRRERIPFVPRGSGTGLSGGATPTAGSVVVSLARMNQILDVDLANERIVVQPGVVNAWVTQRVAPHGYFYAPD